jgi:hypothetical protein
MSLAGYRLSFEEILDTNITEDVALEELSPRNHIILNPQ